jgi:hypothetical protein
MWTGARSRFEVKRRRAETEKGREIRGAHKVGGDVPRSVLPRTIIISLSAVMVFGRDSRRNEVLSFRCVLKKK